MRVYVLWILVAGLMIAAWHSRLVPVFGLILLSVVMQRRDFPSYLMGINGLNPWNLLLLASLFAVVIRHKGSGRSLDLPWRPAVLLLTFLVLIAVAYLRAVSDLDSIPETGPDGFSELRPPVIGFTGDFLINRLKFMVPALLLFDACRTRRSIVTAVGIICFASVAYALLVIRHVPLSTLVSGSEEEFMGFRHRIDRDIGLMAIDMSMLLAGSFWALVAFTLLAVRRRWQQVLMLVPIGILFLGMVLCHSRGSYLGFAAAGLVLAVVRLRAFLLLLPVAIGAIFVFMPAIPARLGMGMGIVDAAGEMTQDWDEVTAGRVTDIWPATIEQIGKGPLLGFGGLACLRTDVYRKWAEISSDLPVHPHNAYLECLVDMGVIGFLPVMALYVGIFVMSFRAFRVRNDSLVAAVGGMGLATVTVLLVTALGCQSFYPSQSTILYWCLWGLTIRVTVERDRATAAARTGAAADTPTAGLPRSSAEARSPARTWPLSGPLPR